MTQTNISQEEKQLRENFIRSLRSFYRFNHVKWLDDQLKNARVERCIHEQNVNPDLMTMPDIDFELKMLMGDF